MGLCQVGSSSAIEFCRVAQTSASLYPFLAVVADVARVAKDVDAYRRVGPKGRVSPNWVKARLAVIVWL